MLTNTTTVTSLLPGDGVGFTYSWGFLAEASSNLEVYLLDTTADPDKLTLLAEGAGSTKYSIDSGSLGNESGGSITYPADSGTPIPSTKSIVMRRVTPLTQTTDLKNQGSYNPSSVENRLDIMTQIAQQSYEEIDRSIRMAISNQSFDPKLPPVDTSKPFLSLNSGGTGLEWVSSLEGDVDLSELDTTGATTNDLMQFNGTSWTYATNIVLGGTLTVGTSLALATGATVTGIDTTLTADLDTLLVTQKAVKGYVDAAIAGSNSLQEAYDVSELILTDATRGSVDFQRGSLLDTDEVFRVLDGVGVKKFSVKGDGTTKVLGELQLDAGSAVIAMASTGIIEANSNTAISITSSGAVTVPVSLTSTGNLLVNGTGTFNGTTLEVATGAVSSPTGGAVLRVYQNDSAATASGHQLGSFIFGSAVDAFDTVEDTASISALATELHSGSAEGTQLLFRVTANGATSQSTSLTLDQDLSATFAGDVDIAGTADIVGARQHLGTAGLTVTQGVGSGVTTIDGLYDDFVIDADNNCGMALFAPVDKQAGIIFGDTVDNNAGRIIYKMSSNAAPDTMVLLTKGLTALTIDNAQNALFAGGVEVGGDLTLGASNGVNKIWTKYLPANELYLATGNPPALANHQSTNSFMYLLDFDDGGISATETAGFTLDLGADYDGSDLVINYFWFSAAATTGNIVWRAHWSTIAEGDAVGQTGYTVDITDATNATAGDLTVSTSDAFTPTNSGRLLVGKFFRWGGNASDTLVGDARLIGISVSYA